MGTQRQALSRPGVCRHGQRPLRLRVRPQRCQRCDFTLKMLKFTLQMMMNVTLKMMDLTVMDLKMMDLLSKRPPLRPWSPTTVA